MSTWGAMEEVVAPQSLKTDLYTRLQLQGERRCELPRKQIKEISAPASNICHQQQTSHWLASGCGHRHQDEWYNVQQVRCTTSWCTEHWHTQPFPMWNTCPIPKIHNLVTAWCALELCQQLLNILRYNINARLEVSQHETSCIFYGYSHKRLLHQK